MRCWEKAILLNPSKVTVIKQAAWLTFESFASNWILTFG
jgi:hypothetical protein